MIEDPDRVLIGANKPCEGIVYRSGCPYMWVSKGELVWYLEEVVDENGKPLKDKLEDLDKRCKKGYGRHKEFCKEECPEE